MLPRMPSLDSLKSSWESFQVHESVNLYKGGGGTQRLIRAIGKGKAMEMILTGRMMDASEAEACGLIAKVLPIDKLQEYSLNIADQIGKYSPIAVELAKEAILQAEEMPLSNGLTFERRLFHATFATV